MSRPPANQGETGAVTGTRWEGRGAGEEAGASHVPRRAAATPFARQSPAAGLRLRPFGILPEDLAIDFGQPSRVRLGCQVLRCCVSDSRGDTPDLSWFEELTIGKRLEYLAAVLAADGESTLALQVPCAQPDCRGLMEVDLSLREISALQQQSELQDAATLAIEAGTVRVRRPTGRDQQAWQAVCFADEAEAATAIARTLMSTDSDRQVPLSTRDLQVVNDALQELDPLADFTVILDCPYCTHQGQYAFDLEQIVLRRLHRRQVGLLHAVHRLATRYHWSEQEIFTIPPWRRSRYLALIDEEAGT